MPKTLIVVAGPTAIGKTALAIQIAQFFKTEIISADSRQFYKEMSIGTAKPSVEELAAVKHHFIDSHSVTENFSVGDFEKKGIALIEELFRQHDQLVLVGGSGLFVQAICSGFDELPVASAEIRDELNMLLIEKGIEHLQEILRIADPSYYAEVDRNNPQRLIRALEVWRTTGKAFSEFRTQVAKTRPFSVIKLGLNTDRTSLYKRINSRVDTMMNEGLLAEVSNLAGFKHLNALNTVGYSELFDYLEGKCSLDEAIGKIKQNTRRFAKRQITWFTKVKDITWFDPEELQAILEFLNSRLTTTPTSPDANSK